MKMKAINNQFALLPHTVSVSLCIDQVASCITDEKIFGTVCVNLTPQSAEQLAFALLEYVGSMKPPAAAAQGRTLARQAIDAALAAARVAAGRITPAREDA